MIETMDYWKKLNPRSNLKCGSKFHYDSLWNLIEEKAVSLEVVIEVGTYLGEFAEGLMTRWEDRVTHYFAIDPWWQRHPQKYMRWWMKRVEPWLWSKVHPLKGTSVEWAGVLPYRPDLVFIDGDHRYEAVLKDLETWWPRLKSGGLLIIHDFHDKKTQKATIDYFGDLGEWIFSGPNIRGRVCKAGWRLKP